MAYPPPNVTQKMKPISARGVPSGYHRCTGYILPKPLFSNHLPLPLLSACSVSPFAEASSKPTGPPAKHERNDNEKCSLHSSASTIRPPSRSGLLASHLQLCAGHPQA